jgi:agmatine deiminase
MGVSLAYLKCFMPPNPLGTMHSRNVRIGLVQNKVSVDIADNLSRSLALAREAAFQGARIICLQELFRTPYFPQDECIDATAYAESIPGESTREFSKFARSCDVSVIVPLFEKGMDGRYYNSAVVIDNTGTILPPYRKVHIPHDPLFYEQNYFEAGDNYRVFTCGSLKIGVLICYDQWFPEAARAVTLMGADIIFYPTAIGWIRGLEEPLEGDWRVAWETVQRGHAIANGVYVAAVNRCGTEGDLIFWGSSFVSDSFGNVLARAGSDDDEVVIVDISPDKNEMVREGWGFLRNRRPDTYDILTREK